MCSFDRIQRGNYFGGEPIARAEVEVRVRKLKNGKAVAKDEITGEIRSGGNYSDRLDLNMDFESGVVHEDWKPAMIVLNYRDISLISVVGKILSGILVDRFHSNWGFD